MDKIYDLFSGALGHFKGLLPLGALLLVAIMIYLVLFFYQVLMTFILQNHHVRKGIVGLVALSYAFFAWLDSAELLLPVTFLFAVFITEYIFLLFTPQARAHRHEKHDAHVAQVAQNATDTTTDTQGAESGSDTPIGKKKKEKPQKPQPKSTGDASLDATQDAINAIQKQLMAVLSDTTDTKPAPAKPEKPAPKTDESPEEQAIEAMEAELANESAPAPEPEPTPEPTPEPLITPYEKPKKPEHKPHPPLVIPEPKHEPKHERKTEHAEKILFGEHKTITHNVTRHHKSAFIETPPPENVAPLPLTLPTIETDHTPIETVRVVNTIEKTKTKPAPKVKIKREVKHVKHVATRAPKQRVKFRPKIERIREKAELIERQRQRAVKTADVIVPTDISYSQGTREAKATAEESALRMEELQRRLDSARKTVTVREVKPVEVIREVVKPIEIIREVRVVEKVDKVDKRETRAITETKQQRSVTTSGDTRSIRELRLEHDKLRFQYETLQNKLEQIKYEQNIERNMQKELNYSTPRVPVRNKFDEEEVKIALVGLREAMNDLQREIDTKR